VVIVSKIANLLLIAVLTLLSLTIVGFAFAQSISKPSIPEFTAEFVDHSYIVPASTTIDPYNGEQITHPSYTVENKTIDITIKNQPIVRPDNYTNLFYNIREKGYFEGNWSELFHITNKTNDNALHRQSGSEYTVISIPDTFPQGGKVDFQVEAVIATAHPFWSGSNFGIWTWEESGWSNTQTVIVLISSSSSSSQAPDQTIETPQTWQLITILGLITGITVVVAVSLVYFKKRKR
jgi:hypothetical protein